MIVSYLISGRSASTNWMGQRTLLRRMVFVPCRLHLQARSTPGHTLSRAPP